MALYVFSDAHLGADSAERESEKVAKLKRLFELIEGDGDRLVILGDLFDFWFEYKHAIPKDHHRVLFMLSGLAETGIEIHYVSGNHDFWMGDFFENQLRMHLHRDLLDMIYAGRKLHLVHGDGLATADRGYRFLKRILRNPVNIWLYRKLSPDWAIPLAKKVSGSSRTYTARRDPAFEADYERYAFARLESGCDVVLIGHLHRPSVSTHAGGTYINTGDFIDNFSYVKITSEETSLQFLK